MTLDTDIVNTVLSAKCTAGYWSTQIINQEKNGQDTGCDKKKLMMLILFVLVLEDYWCSNFSAQGSITPGFPCLSQSDAVQLLANLKVLIGI
jgi:hypothetical protein